MSCTKIIIWSAIFINDIWILANPHQNWIVHVWTAKDSWRTLEYSWNDYFGILPTATIQDTSNFKANNHLNRNKSSVLKQYILRTLLAPRSNHWQGFALCGSHPHFKIIKKRSFDLSQASFLKNLGRGGFEPPYPLGNRFTVCRL